PAATERSGRSQLSLTWKPSAHGLPNCNLSTARNGSGDCARRSSFIASDRGTERERHRALDCDVAVDTGHAFEQPHTRTQTHDVGFNYHHVTGVDRAAIANPLDPGEEWQTLAVLRLRQDKDRAYLRHRFGEDRRRKYGCAAGRVRQVSLVERHVLDTDDAL